MKLWKLNLLIISLIAISSPLFSTIKLNDDDAYALGMRVWKNEARGRLDEIIWWNKNENFASMGIGHFLWFPKEHEKGYVGSFSTFISFLQEKEVPVPEWLSKKNAPCPWDSKESFDKATNSTKMKELRTLLNNTIPLQALYIADRLQNALPQILNTIDSPKKDHVQRMFECLSHTPQGIYALTDYINFKGEGISDMLNHRSGGWGLKHVLQGMPADTDTERAVWEFVRSAKKRLLERVLENPQKRSERTWLLGWKNRLDTYLVP